MRKNRSVEQESLLRQLQYIADGLGQTFAPFCEIVVHDLLHPEHAVSSIENNLSGRKLGDPATELGLARISDDAYPQVIANYANRFADGRQVKSTSIGIKDSEGCYVAALCVNVDLSIFNGFAGIVEQFGRLAGEPGIKENLDPANADAIRARIDSYAAARSTTPRALKTHDRRDLVRSLKAAGFMQMRHSTEVVAQHLGVSRATVYTDAK
jgi:predicted transcriptional regulator YheO